MASPVVWSLAEFRAQALKQVNAHRHLHSAEPLVQSDELEKSAQSWAEALATKSALTNSPDAKAGKYGESISCRKSSGGTQDQAKGKVEMTADEVIAMWYNEKSSFDFKDPGNAKGSNFTQMVWQNTKEVGFGRAQAEGRTVVVAHYTPPGNVRGAYGKMVSPVASAGAQDANEFVGELAGFSPVSREVLRDEEFEDGRAVVIERERIQFEDAKGNTKEKVNERRFYKPKSSGPTEQEISSRQGSIVPIKDKDLSKFASKVLNQHNRHRSSHGAKSLKLNSDLSALAQSFAEELSSKTRLYNSGATYRGERLGENIASRWSHGAADFDGEEVVDHWYSECDKYAFNEEPADIDGVGNFTQLVWRNTKELGVGKAVHRGTDGSHKVVVVCYYHPSGNVMPCFRENVMPPGK